MATPVDTNPGPAIAQSANTQSPRGDFQFIQVIGVNMTPVGVSANTSAEQSFGSAGASQATAATGILPGDVLLSVSPPSLTAGTGIVGYRVDTSTADKFYVEFSNMTSGSLTPASGVWLVVVGRLNSSTTTTPGTLSTLPASLTGN